jgi:hypothetical protein
MFQYLFTYSYDGYGSLTTARQPLVQGKIETPQSFSWTERSCFLKMAFQSFFRGITYCEVSQFPPPDQHSRSDLISDMNPIIGLINVKRYGR